MDTGVRCRVCGNVLVMKKVKHTVTVPKPFEIIRIGAGKQLLYGEVEIEEYYCCGCGLQYESDFVKGMQRQGIGGVCKVCNGKKEIPCHSFDIEGMIPCTHCKETGVEPVTA